MMPNNGCTLILLDSGEKFGGFSIFLLVLNLLTYFDEDGDVVALVDDDDLYDVMRQGLKFLRINVQLDSDKLGKPYGASSRSSTLRSSPFQTRSEGLNAGADDVVKSVQEPLRRAVSDAFSKLSLDAAVKAVSVRPVLNDLVDCLSKMGQSYSYLSPVSKSGTASDSSIPVESSGSNCTTSVSKPTDVDSICKDNKEGNTANAARGVDVSAISDLGSFYLNANPLSNANLTGCAPVSSQQSSSNVFPCNDLKNTKESMVRKKGKSVSFDTSAPFDATKKYDPINMMGRDPSNECPSGGMPVGSEAVVPPPFSRSKRMFVSTDENRTPGTFHKGIQCDGCGVLPIAGTRFKSKVKDDYNLCSICFSKMGNEADYIRMEESARASNDHIQRELHVWKNHVAEPMLASCFVSDINIIDGTVMVPSAPFTKIWRMHNNGTTPWFQGFQLIWIGGDKLRDSTTVDLEIPADGVPVDGELDIAVDFTAPQVPGQYVSYWRMASQTGINFGQYVWVLIHVDDSLKNMSGDDFQDLKMNLPSENTIPRDTEICNSNADTALIEPLSNEQLTKEQALNNRDVLTPFLSPTISSSVAYPFIPKGFPVPTSPETPASPSYPIIDLSEEATAGAIATREPLPLTPYDENSENAIEQTLLKELEDMGFKQVNLNKEILRMNKYNLEKSIDDLCGTSEWDPMLEELQEMGFCDMEMNKLLLKKHKGSIRGAAVDLISEETA